MTRSSGHDSLSDSSTLTNFFVYLQLHMLRFAIHDISFAVDFLILFVTFGHIEKKHFFHICFSGLASLQYRGIFHKLMLRGALFTSAGGY